MTLEDLRTELAARRAHLGGALNAQVNAGALLDEVLALIDQVDGREAIGDRDLTSREAAAQLGLVSHRTVERYCRERRLPGAYKTSDNTGDWRIPAAAVQVFRGCGTGKSTVAHIGARVRRAAR